jgi:hypothetical protein
VHIPTIVHGAKESVIYDVTVYPKPDDSIETVIDPPITIEDVDPGGKIKKPHPVKRPDPIRRIIDKVPAGLPRTGDYFPVWIVIGVMVTLGTFLILLFGHKRRKAKEKQAHNVRGDP